MGQSHLDLYPFGTTRFGGVRDVQSEFLFVHERKIGIDLDLIAEQS